MSLTPLFTTAELDAQIATYKAALTTLASGQSYTFEVGGMRQQLTRADLPEIRQTLEWLQGQRQAVELGGGPQVVAGRVQRW